MRRMTLALVLLVLWGVQVVEQEQLEAGWATFNAHQFRDALKMAQEVPKREMPSEAYAPRGGIA